ncbi:MAG: hypothetical protein P1V51_10780 [Deltaproteobacteria bacterium]|nr:hypothetical protein [Deltaproteobacteria bacterium]
MRSRTTIRSAALTLVALFSVPVLTAGLLIAGGCGDDTVVRYRPQFDVVDGTPAVDTGLPGIDDQQPTVNPADFANNAPIQVDVFFQKTVRKVDILWVVDNSCSMVEEQSKLSTNFGSFINDLASADPPVDYHLGIITTDASSEGGALRPLATNSSLRYIECNNNGGSTCNVPNEVSAFQQTVNVGSNGGALEKGLLAAHLALVDPMKSTLNAGFLRDDAALYVIFVSDEGDASCSPLTPQPSGTDKTACNFFPFCSCGNTASGYGDTDYYVRFFEGLKGYGNEGLVAVAGIVGTENTPVTIGGENWLGCRATDGSGTAYYAPRYVDVANRTGGITTSICESDYSTALEALGFAVSGQRTDFGLSRRPIRPDVAPLKVYVQDDPLDPSTRREVPEASTNPAADGGWEWILCESTNFTNAIRFSGNWIPLPKAKITVNYQVDVGGGRSCTP